MYFLTDAPSEHWLIAPLIIYGRYFLLCGWLFVLFYLWKQRAWFYRKIQKKFPARADYLREIGYSALTAVIFAGMGWLWLGTPLRAYTRFYTDISEHGIVYLVLSVPVLLFLHDSYFYWMHRLMHHPRLYRHIHLVHHRSVNPSPWAAYAFHPVEAVMEAGIIPLILLLVPVHPVALFTFVTLMLWFNVYGHLGYELFPKKMYEHPLGRWLNSSVYHNRHHERFQGNYSLYFCCWDRWMGTLRPDNEVQVAAIHDQIESFHKTQQDTRSHV